VLLVTDGNYFLERAIDSLNLRQPDSMTRAAYEANVPDDYDVIIFDRHSPTRLPPAGNFIYFGAVPADMGLQVALEEDEPVVMEEVGVLDWQREHPILRHLLLLKLL
jgi:hypothetical protein